MYPNLPIVESLIVTTSVYVTKELSSVKSTVLHGSSVIERGNVRGLCSKLALDFHWEREKLPPARLTKLLSLNM